MIRSRWLLGLAGLVLLFACSNDDASSGGPTVSTSTVPRQTPDESTTSSSAVGSTQAPATDVTAVTEVLQRLIDAYDAAVAEILRDPRVAGDTASEPVRAYLALFGPGSSFAEGALRFWSQEGASGRFYRPGPRGQLTESTVVSVSPSSPDEVTFTVCALDSIEVVDVDGSLIESQGGQSAATVVATRIGGIWKLRDLTQVGPTVCPAREGA